MREEPIIIAMKAELRKYRRDKNKLAYLREQLYIETERLYSPRGAALSTVPIHGGGNANENALANGVTKKDELRTEIADCKSRIAPMEYYIKQLTTDEQEVIRLMYIDDCVNAYGAGMIMHRCKTRIYVIRNAALYKLFDYTHEKAE